MMTSFEELLTSYRWPIKRYIDRPNTVGIMQLTRKDWNDLWAESESIHTAPIIPNSNRISCADRTYLEKTYMSASIDELAKLIDETYLKNELVIISDIFKLQNNDGKRHFMIKWIIVPYYKAEKE